MFRISTQSQQKVYWACIVSSAVAGSIILATSPLTIATIGVGVMLLFCSLTLMINLSISQSVPPPPRYTVIL